MHMQIARMQSLAANPGRVPRKANWFSIQHPGGGVDRAPLDRGAVKLVARHASSGLCQQLIMIRDHGPVAQHESLGHDCVGFNCANHGLAIHTAT